MWVKSIYNILDFSHFVLQKPSTFIPSTYFDTLPPSVTIFVLGMMVGYHEERRSSERRRFNTWLSHLTLLTWFRYLGIEFLGWISV